MTEASRQKETNRVPSPLDAGAGRFGLPPVIRDGLWSFLISFGSKASVLAQIAIAARLGGPTGLGAFAQLVAASVLISSLCDFGFSTEATRYAAAVGDRVDLRVIWLRLFPRVMAAAALTAGTVLFFGVMQNDVSLPSILFTTMYACALIAGAVGIAVANGIGMFRFTGTTLGIARLCSIPLSFLAFLGGSPNSVLIASIAISEAAAALLIWRQVRQAGARSLKPISVQTIDHRRALQFGGAAFINILINRSDIFLLSSVMPLAALGAYATASQLENAVTTVALVPATALMVHIARSTQDGDELASRNAFHSTATVVALLSLAMALVLAAAAPFWIPIAFGDAMSSSVVPVRIVMVGATFNCLAGVTLMALAGLGRSRSVLRVWLITAAISVPVMYVLAKSYGEVGAALGALVRDAILVTAAVMAALRTSLMKKGGQMLHSVYGRTTRAGLGNELFPVIRAALIAHDRGIMELQPVWIRPRLGPMIRGERDKRRYHTLFRPPGVRGVTVRAFVLLTGQRFDESGRKIRRGLPGIGVTVVTGMARHFETFRGRHELVLRQLESRSRDLDLRCDGRSVAMHVRLGDFQEASDNSVIDTNRSTSMRWFVEAAVAVVESGSSVTVFSDGNDSELAPLLSIPLVSRAPTGTALSDMISMSSHQFIVGSGSTFTAWAAFLGDKPLLLFPGTNHYLKWSEKVVEEASAIYGVSRIRSMMSVSDVDVRMEN